MLKDSGVRRYGMVLTFDTVKDAQKARRLLAESGLIDPHMDDGGSLIRTPESIHEYDPDWGGPVWYIP